MNLTLELIDQFSYGPKVWKVYKKRPKASDMSKAGDIKSEEKLVGNIGCVGCPGRGAFWAVTIVEGRLLSVMSIALGNVSAEIVLPYPFYFRY